MRFCFASNKINHDWVSLVESYKRYVNKNSVVLEIGASNIERTKELGKFCKEVIAVELVPERLPKGAGNIKHLIGDWQNLSEFIQPNSIDIVVSSHVIEHIPDDLKAINELFRVLKPGGAAFLNTPNRKRLVRSIIEIFTGERKFPFWEHQREYIESDLLHLLGASDFKKYKVIPLVFGVHGGPIFLYFESVIPPLRRYANYWEIHLFK